MARKTEHQRQWILNRIWGLQQAAGQQRCVLSLSLSASEAIHVRHILRTDALSGPTQFAPTSVIAQDTSLYPTGYCYCLVVPKAQSERDGDDTARDHMCARHARSPVVAGRG